MKFIRLLLLFFILFGVSIVFLKLFIPSKLIQKFETIEDLHRYANFYPELPKSDNQDWLDPIYISFYKEMFHISPIQKILLALGLKSHVAWDDQAFVKIIKTITKQRMAKQLKSPFNKKIYLPEGGNVIVWGDLHGAFHSLVRDIIYLQKLRVIDNSLKIIKDNTYFLMLGDAVSRSPYSLEVLHIILLLMQKNPDKVIYLRGKHERDEYWENFSMRREILYREGKLTLEAYKQFPLGKIINTFFNTLPDILIIKKIGDLEKQKIICTHENVAQSFIRDKGTKCIIIGETRFVSLKRSYGLTFLGYMGEAAKWSAISCPIEPYQKFFNFYYDAFIELTIGKTIEQSVLTLHNRDISKNGDFKTTYFSPIFGYKLKSKKSNISEKNIVHVGSTMSLTGVAGPLGKENKRGLEIAIRDFNNKNGDILILPALFDDIYIPRLALKNINLLYNTFKIDTIIAPTGTPTLSVYLPMIKKGKIAVLFPYTGASEFRKPDIKNIIHFRVSYEDEIIKALKYLIETHGIKNFAFFYQDDSYGKPIAEAAHKMLQKVGIHKWLDLPHLRTQSNFSEIIKKVRNFSPAAIGCFSSHFPTQEFINELGAEYLAGRILFGVSFLYSEAFQEFLEQRGIQFVLSSVVPNPKTSDLEIAREYMMLTKKFDAVPSLNSFEGYVSGALLTNAIAHLSPPFTKEKIIGYFEQLKNYKFKGLTLTFDPEQRDLSQPVWIRTLRHIWLQFEPQRENKRKNKNG